MARSIPDNMANAPNTICMFYLFERCLDYAQVLMQSLVNFVPSWQDMDGSFQRLLELVAALDIIDGLSECASTGACLGGCAMPNNGHFNNDGGSIAIKVSGLDLVAPRCEGTSAGACLATGVSFDVCPGEPIMVTGPNASGKSLLGGVLFGLVAPFGSQCHVAVSGAAPGGPGRWAGRPSPTMFFCAPQRIYLPTGNLAAQVCYPNSIDPEQPDAVAKFAHEERMLETLRAAGIEHVLAREADGWNAVRTWEEMLSGGEQQRLSVARVIYQRPHFALLDECTSMVQADAEEDLYRCLFRDFKVTPVCLSQRLFMPDLYHTELCLGLGTEAGWKLRALRANASESGI